MAEQTPGRAHTPEQAALLAAIRVDHAGDDELRAILRGGADWGALRRLAVGQGVLPLLYLRIRDAAADLAPREEIERLRGVYMNNAGESLRQAARLARLLKRLEAAGIAALPFKGPALALQAYGNLARRQASADLDILIRPGDLQRASALLISEGYEPDYRVTPKKVKRLTSAHMELGFRGPQGVLDVHWSAAEVFRPSPACTDELWQNLEQVQMEGVPVRVLAPEHTLLMLCEHAEKHHWSTLRAVADIAHLLAAHPQMDWPAIWARAEQGGLLSTLRMALRLAQDVGGAPLPSQTGDRCYGDPDLEKALAGIMSRFFAKGAEERAVPDLERLIPVGTSPERRLAARLALFAAPRPTDFMAIDLPDALYGLYYIIRPLRLLAKYGGQVVSHQFSVIGRQSAPTPENNDRSPGPES